MARSMRGNGNQRFDTSQYTPTEDLLVRPVPIGGFGGMDTESPLPSMDPQKLRLVRNLVIRYGGYSARDGTDVIGTISGTELVYAVDVTLPESGLAYIVRFRTNGVDVWDGANWVATTGAVFTADPDAPFAITGWNEKLLFTAGIGRIFELSFTAGYPVVELAESPLDVIHLATFNGRVVASLKGTTVQWSVKFDHTDWDGLGSGYEDLLSAPGGRPDKQTAIVPISDEAAYCVRSNSIWQMGNTGDFDSPFSFSQVYSGIGTKLPATVARIVRGFIAVGDNGQVWKVTPEGYEDISAPVATAFNIPVANIPRMSAAYDIKFDEYRVVVPGESDTTAQKVMRYSIPNKAWTEDVYPFPIRAISYTQVLTRDDATLGQGIRYPGFIYAMADEGKWVVRDEPGQNNNALRDVNFGGARSAGGFRVESGDVKLSDPIRRQEFVELLCWYESEGEVTINFDYTYDGGAIWNLASQVIVPATNGRPRPISVQRTADRPHLQLSVNSEAVPSFRLISLQAMMREGGRIVDAS